MTEEGNGNREVLTRATLSHLKPQGCRVKRTLGEGRVGAPVEEEVEVILVG